MHMCMITLSDNIFLNKGQKFLHFFYKLIIRLCIEKYLSYLQGVIFLNFQTPMLGGGQETAQKNIILIILGKWLIWKSNLN